MPDSVSELAKAMATGGGVGASLGAVGGPAGMMAGGLTGAAVPFARHMMPVNPDAAGALTQGLLTPFPLNIPYLLGGGAMMMGAKPYSREQMEAFDAQDRSRRGE